MKTRIERTMRDAFLVIEDNPSEGDDFEINMLSNNIIEGLLPLMIRQMEDRQMFMYNVRGKISLKDRYENSELRSEALRRIITGVQSVLKICEEYMIRTEHVLLSPEYLFIDSDTGEVGVCVYPGNDNSLAENLRSLSEYMISKTDHSENEAIDLAYGFYRRVVSGDYRFDDITRIYTEPARQREKYETGEETKKENKKDNTAENNRRKSNNAGKSILGLLIFTIVVFCFALCVLMLYFR